MTYDNRNNARKELPAGWRWARLGEVCKLLSGGTPSKGNDDLWSGDIPWISPKDMKTERIEDSIDHISIKAIDSGATRMVDAGAILCVTRSGILAHTLPVALILRSVAFNQDIRALVPDQSQVDGNYLIYALKSAEWWILTEGVKKGPTVHSLKSGFLENFHIPLPPLATQRAIARQLERDMAEVARLRVAAERQRAAAAALPSAYLREVFESVEARGWPVVRLGEILRLRKDVVHPYDNPTGPAIFVGLEHIEPHTGRRIGSLDVDMSALSGRKPRFYQGDIVYGYLRPYLNKTWLAEFDGLCSVDQYVYSVNLECALAQFIAAFMRSPIYLKRAPIDTTPGQLPRIRTEEVASVELALPPLSEQYDVVQKLESDKAETTQMRNAVERQRQAIDAMPAVLLREVFGGFAG